MTHIYATLKSGERILIAVAHIISVRQLNNGCEIHVSNGLLFNVEEEFRVITEGIKMQPK